MQVIWPQRLFVTWAHIFVACFIKKSFVTFSSIFLMLRFSWLMLLFSSFFSIIRTIVPFMAMPQFHAWIYIFSGFPVLWIVFLQGFFLYLCSFLQVFASFDFLQDCLHLFDCRCSGPIKYLEVSSHSLFFTNSSFLVFSRYFFCSWATSLSISHSVRVHNV